MQPVLHLKYKLDKSDYLQTSSSCCKEGERETSALLVGERDGERTTGIETDLAFPLANICFLVAVVASSLKKRLFMDDVLVLVLDGTSTI